MQSATRSLETSAASFWVYPSFFELRPGETCEVLMLFQPVQPGLHTLPMRLMCDNHTYRPIELIGDAVCFDADMLEVAVSAPHAQPDPEPAHSLGLVPRSPRRLPACKPAPAIASSWATAERRFSLCGSPIAARSPWATAWKWGPGCGFPTSPPSASPPTAPPS